MNGAGKEEGEASMSVGAAGEEEEPRGSARHGRDLMSLRRPHRKGGSEREEGEKEAGGVGV